MASASVDAVAMGRSLGTSSTVAEDAQLGAALARLRNRVVLFVGDSTLRNQFMQTARIGLGFARETPVARGIAARNHTGVFWLPHQLTQPDRLDSSNGFWGGFPWLIASTPGNLTLVYAKVWGCAGLEGVVRKMRAVMRRHRDRSGFGGWPPDLTMWNFGLHLLHVYPARPVPTTSVRCALGYEALLERSARTLRAELPSTRLVYRTTNAVCDARFAGSWANSARAYHCAAEYEGSAPAATQCAEFSERNARLLKVCRARYNVSTAECVRTFMDEANARRQQAGARRVLGAATRVVLFDAHALTAGQCALTADGRHYPRRRRRRAP